jgi:serine protease Do
MAGEGTRWRFPKLPDWLIYAAVVAALLAAALSRRENADAPPAPPPLSREEGRLLLSASTFAPRSVIKVSADPSGPQSGAAFSIASKGVWLTARHVIAGCSRIALMEAPDKAAEARAAPESDLEPPTDVAVLTTQGGAPPLALADGAGLRIGERGFHPGFPQGRAGEVTTRLLGRQTLVFRTRAGGRSPMHAESVLSWAEAGRTGGLRGDLAGLSGAPVLDARGRVVASPWPKRPGAGASTPPPSTPSGARSPLLTWRQRRRRRRPTRSPSPTTACGRTICGATSRWRR